MWWGYKPHAKFSAFPPFLVTQVYPLKWFRVSSLLRWFTLGDPQGDWITIGLSFLENDGISPWLSPWLWTGVLHFPSLSNTVTFRLIVHKHKIILFQSFTLCQDITIPFKLLMQYTEGKFVEIIMLGIWRKLPNWKLPNTALLQNVQ